MNVDIIPKDPRFINLTREKFNKLVVESYAGKRNNAHYWNCICDCGNKKAIPGSNIKNGQAKSCGCLRIEATTKRLTTHGKSRTPTYNIWCSMRERCSNEKVKNYHRYGGRGVKVCARWENSFESFYFDMGEKPEGLSIDRIDNNGNYEPGNCKWSTNCEQSSNRRTRCDNKLGISGIHKAKNEKKYRVSMKRNKKHTHLGMFNCFLDACCARKSAENKLIRGLKWI